MITLTVGEIRAYRKNIGYDTEGDDFLIVWRTKLNEDGADLLNRCGEDRTWTPGDIYTTINVAGFSHKDDAVSEMHDHVANFWNSDNGDHYESFVVNLAELTDERLRELDVNYQFAAV